MRVTKLRIDGQEFYLPEDVDVSALQQEILAAVRGEAAFITFRPVGHGDITALVTSHIPVRFEVEEHSEEQVQQWEDDPPAIDVSEYFHAIASTEEANVG